MEICKGFTCENWAALQPRLNANEETAWTEAIGVFERRMNERYFRCIDRLLSVDRPATDGEPIVPGFSTMALCCLVAETLQSFYSGGPQPRILKEGETCRYPDMGCLKEPSTARAFKDFLASSPHFSHDFVNSEIRGDFAVNVRNALLHEAETRSGWLIRRSDPKDRIVRRIEGGYVLNRTKFYEALFAEFKDYLGRLGDGSRTDDLRNNFLKKMEILCSHEPDIE
jgi:hypothetical protein